MINKINLNQDERGRDIDVATINARMRTHSPRVRGVEASGRVKLIEAVRKKKIISDIYELGVKPCL